MYSIRMRALLLLIGISITGAAFATRWPVFVAPEQAFLLAKGYLETESCPHGEGRVMPGIVINVSQFLCKNFCPGSWSWIADSDAACHPLDHFSLRYHVIQNHDDANGTADASVITAFYGKHSENESILTFVLKTAPGDAWQCSETNPAQHWLSCTNDI